MDRHRQGVIELGTIALVIVVMYAVCRWVFRIPLPTP